MFKTVYVKEGISGSLVYQAEREKYVLNRFDSELNNLKVTKVHSVSLIKGESEFGLVAVVEVADVPVVIPTPKQPLSTQSPRRLK